jgi:hypothetical protein
MTKKKHLHKKAKVAQPLDSEQRQNADKCFEHGQYQQALKLYKILWKAIDPKEINSSVSKALKERLLLCYSERATTLTLKKMYKEACILWEAHQQYHPPTTLEFIEYYLLCLLFSGKLKKAAQLLTTYFNELKYSDRYSWFCSILALKLFLTRDTVIITSLPSDLFNFDPVTDVISLFDDPQFNQTMIENALHKISLRGAFKELRVALKGLLLYFSDLKQAQHLINKISVQSPYFAITKIIKAATLSGIALMEYLPTLTSHQFKLLGYLKGWTPQQCKQIMTFMQVFTDNDVKKKLDLLIQLKDHVPMILLKSYALKLLFHYPSGKMAVCHHFGAISPFEEKWISAIFQEKTEHFHMAYRDWEEGINLLKKEPSFAEQRQTIGLIKLHQASLTKKMDDDFWSIEKNYIDLLIESVDYLDDTRLEETMLTICQFYKASKQSKHYAEWLKKTQKKYPKNVDALLLAAENAVLRNQHKKAITFSSIVLNLDPSNSLAKQLLTHAKILQIRERIKQKKFTDLTQQIESAVTYQNSVQAPQIFAILHALGCYAQEKYAQAITYWSETYQKNQDNMLVYYVTLLEAKLAQIDLDPINNFLKKQCQIPITAEPLTYHILALSLTRIVAYSEQNQNLKQNVKEQILLYLWKKMHIQKKLSKDKPHENDLIVLCEKMGVLHAWPYSQWFAKQGEKYYSCMSVFTYYDIESQCHQTQSISEKNFYRLENLLLIVENSNPTLAIKIDNLLRKFAHRGC